MMGGMVCEDKKGFLENQKPSESHVVGDTGFEPVTSTV